MARTKVQSELIATNAISGTIIADGAITSTHLAANCVDSSELVTGSIDTIHIAANQVTATKIVTNGVLTRHISDDQVTAAKLANSINTDIATGVTANTTANAALPKAGGTMTGSLGVGDTAVSSIVGLFSTSTANHIAGQFVNSNASDSFGIVVKAGNDANDYTADFRDKANNNLMRIRGDGNVGIGTSSPQETLHLFNSAQTWNQYSNIRMSTENDSYAAEIGFHRGTSDDSDRGLFLSGDGTNKHVRVLHGGKVGIGTSSPSSLLHMESGNAHNKLSITSTANGGTGYDAVIDLLGSASNSEVQLNMGINGDADREQIKTYQSVMTFTTNNVERMKIDTADIVLTTTGNANAQLSIKNSSASGQSGVQLSGYDDNHAMTFRRGYDGSLNVIDFYEYGNSGGDAYRWFTNGVQANQTQKLNLQTDGELIQGTAIADTYSPLVVGITADALVAGRHATSGSLGIWRTNTMEFKVYHNGQGYIMTWGSNGVVSGDFNDTSDVNLKENISTIADGTTVIKALRPVKFDWKASGKGNNQHGFIAQEVETVLPDAVEGNNYVENETGLPEDEPAGNGKTMNSNAVLAHAVKAIQELEARIKTLEG